jgi:hypothetical protein
MNQEIHLLPQHKRDKGFPPETSSQKMRKTTGIGDDMKDNTANGLRILYATRRAALTMADYYCAMSMQL